MEAYILFLFLCIGYQYMVCLSLKITTAVCTPILGVLLSAHFTCSWEKEGGLGGFGGWGERVAGRTHARDLDIARSCRCNLYFNHLYLIINLNGSSCPSVNGRKESCVVISHHKRLGLASVCSVEFRDDGSALLQPLPDTEIERCALTKERILHRAAVAPPF